MLDHDHVPGDRSPHVIEIPDRAPTADRPPQTVCPPLSARAPPHRRLRLAERRELAAGDARPNPAACGRPGVPRSRERLDRGGDGASRSAPRHAFRRDPRADQGRRFERPGQGRRMGILRALPRRRAASGDLPAPGRRRLGKRRGGRPHGRRPGCGGCAIGRRKSRGRHRGRCRDRKGFGRYRGRCRDRKCRQRRRRPRRNGRRHRGRHGRRHGRRRQSHRRGDPARRRRGSRGQELLPHRGRRPQPRSPALRLDRGRERLGVLHATREGPRHGPAARRRDRALLGRLRVDGGRPHPLLHRARRQPSPVQGLPPSAWRRSRGRRARLRRAGSGVLRERRPHRIAPFPADRRARPRHQRGAAGRCGPSR